MINRDDIEVGDKCYTRDGGCLVAYSGNGVWVGTSKLSEAWRENGEFWNKPEHSNLDIIRIEKAPKPVVATVTIGSDDMKEWFFTTSPSLYDRFIKLTIINGKLEKSEQVK